MAPDTTLDQLSINTLRTLSIDAVQQANSGHPGLPLGAAPMAYALWTRLLKHNPNNPHWPDRDRFVLSAGHGSMLLYSLLYLTGYDLTLDDLKHFRQLHSPTPGHPEYGEAPGVETTTGPLGQGLGTAVGMAAAEAFLAATFNRPGHAVVDHYTYVLASDGDLMEGLSHEAASLAGHWGLGKLIVLYDDNQVSLAGPTSDTFSEDIPARFAAYGWHTRTVEDGSAIDAVEAALKAAQAVPDRPSLISVRTVIGYGSPNKAGTFQAHGSPLGEDEVKLTKAALGWPEAEPFYVPEEALANFRQAVAVGDAAEGAWGKALLAYEAEFPELAAQFRAAINGELPADWQAALPVFLADEKGDATRSSSGKVLNAIAGVVPTFLGGDADLAPSTKTTIKGEGDFGSGKYAARNLRFGVREHAMGTIVNGMTLHGGIIKPYSATFFTFSDYMRPAIRLGALMNIPAVYVFTHDSVGVGEDGPTHQPVEQLMSLRAMPNLTVIRPGDANETAGAWRAAMLAEGPVVLVFSRQAMPTLDPNLVKDVTKGAYVLYNGRDGTPEVILIGTGSELQFALAAGQQLAAEGINARVVSMPSMELFARQPAAYQEAVLPRAVTARVSIEAGVTFGWQRWVGPEGISIGVDRFGESAPWKHIYEHLGLTAEAVAAAAKRLLNK